MSRGWIALIAAGIAVLVAVVVAVVIVSTTDDDHSERASTKPDITALDEGMLIPQSAFPGPPGGEFHLSEVRTNEVNSSDSESCDVDDRLFLGQFQETAAYFTYEDSSLRYNVELFIPQGEPDVQGWADDCLPSEDYGQRVELSGLPPWAVAFGDGNILAAFGDYRGVLVEAFIRGTESAPDAEAELVSMFNKQIARLEAQ